MDSATFLPAPADFATIANHAGQEAENWECMAVVPPIVLGSTFKHMSPTEHKKYEYARTGTPTRDSLQTCLAALEGSKYGLVFPSGLGALTALVNLFSTGDQIICTDELYGGSFRLLKHVESHFKLEITFVDCTKVENIENAVTTNTKMIFIETPTNPTLKVIDINKIAAIANKNKIMFVVDNTFLTSYLQRPLEMGADISFYSITKYMAGHTDVIMGGIVTKSEEIYEKLKFIQNAMGLIPSPFDCYQALRGIKTLQIRLKQHAVNAYAIAKFLESHPKVKKVFYPSLPSHPQYDITKNQTSGSSGMLAFYIKGDEATCTKFLKALKVFTLAGSLGGTESLIAMPYHMTHPQLSADEKKRLNITVTLIRVSVGIEDSESLIADMKQAFDKC